MRLPRRLRFTRAGGGFAGGALAIGFAAINTGNNLLYLLLGGVLGFIALSGWLSEQALRGVRVRRRLPGAATVGRPVRIGYELTNGKRHLPSLALEVIERELDDARAFVAEVAPAGSADAHVEMVFHRRGRYALEEVSLATSFPFGFFTKSRDVALPGSFLVWPRHDLPVREPRPAGLRARRSGSAAAGAAGGRGEFRGLREYRHGDDPRDVHWPSTARLGEPVVREYEREDADVLWIFLDPRAEPGAAAERAVETAASLAARAALQGRRFGLATAGVTIPPAAGGAQLRRVLDALAAVEIAPSAARGPLPAPPAACVWVGVGGGGAGFGDRFRAGEGEDDGAGAPSP